MAEIGTPAAIRPIMGTTAARGAPSLLEATGFTRPRLPWMTLGVKDCFARREAWRMAFRQLQHLERPRPVRHAPQEAAFLKGHDQAMDAGLGLKIEGLLHLLERRRDAFFLQAFVDEHEEFELLARQHMASPRLAGFLNRNKPETSLQVAI